MTCTQAYIEYRAKQAQLIEPSIEAADAPREMLAAPPRMVIVPRDCYFTSDDEYDLIQDEAENDFFQEMQEGRQHSEGHSARQAW